MIIGDLFAGVGGMSEGFRMAGFDVAFAIEYDKDIAASYKKNHTDTDVIADYWWSTMSGLLSKG